MGARQPQTATAQATEKARRRGMGIAPVVCAVALLVALLVVYAAISARAPIATPARGVANQRAAALPALPPLGALVYTQQPCVPVYTAPDAASPMITQLLGGTDVTLLGTAGQWTRVRIWSQTTGYAPTSALGAAEPAVAAEGNCTFPGVADPTPDVLPASSGPFTLAAQVHTLHPSTLYAWPDFSAPPLSGVAQGVTVSVSHWASDAAGSPWYYVRAGANAAGWLWSGDARVNAPDPAQTTVNGRPIWSPVAGKGMWFTNYLTRHADLTRLVADAKAAGVTHIYAEVAITQWGFYAPVSLDRLLQVAHAQGIAVIAWVYPTLSNVAADVRMTLQVAHYRTPTGDHADGIATDVEETIDAQSVYSYGQLLRAALGPNTLLVDAALHPLAHPEYPYAAVAASWNVLAPMNYWHSKRAHAYTVADVQNFVTTSVNDIRAAMRAGGVARPIPIEELGQTYDMFSQDSAGVTNSPTGAEISADLHTAKALGCIGASYFEWQTATQAQWGAFSSYQWP